MDSDTCTGGLPGGASCSVTVHFTPGALGSRSAKLLFSASPGGIHTVVLQGVGVNTLTVSPTSYNFPDQHVGTTSAATGFVLTNYGSSPLSAFSLTTTDGTDLPVTADSCVGATLATGASCTVSVAFNAAVLGTHSSTLTATFHDPGQTPYTAAFTAAGTSIVPPPDLSTTMTVLSQNFNAGTVQITVTNLGSAASVPATMTVDADPTQSFSYSAGAGTDCTAATVNGWDSRFTCPVPAIAAGATYTRVLTVNNLSGQAPHYIQCDATTVMTGDSNASNNTGYATLTLS
jgi:hypothetical protein